MALRDDPGKAELTWGTILLDSKLSVDHMSMKGIVDVMGTPTQECQQTLSSAQRVNTVEAGFMEPRLTSFNASPWYRGDMPLKSPVSNLVLASILPVRSPERVPYFSTDSVGIVILYLDQGENSRRLKSLAPGKPPESRSF